MIIKEIVKIKCQNLWLLYKPLLIYKMQEDPAYLEMVRKSYILQKFPDL